MLVFSPNSLIGKIFPYSKWFIYGLLFINMTLFFQNQTIDEGIDSLAWLVLLLLLEWETSQLNQKNIYKLEKYLLRIGRLLAYIAIVYTIYQYSTASYIEENGTLDIYNATIWFIVVMLIEYEIFFKKIASNFINFFKIALYLSLFVIAILWQIDGEWLDFYDAALWIVCFFFIELNILQFEDKISKEEECL
jgi:CDP-diglyceride synthetase